MEKKPSTDVTLSSPPPLWVLRTVNHLMRPLLRSRLATRMSGVMLLEFRGRRTGRTITVPVNMNRVDGVVTAFTGAPWRHNFQDGAPATVTYRGHPHQTRGTLTRMTPEEMGLAVFKALDAGASAQRMGIRAPKGHQPTAAELAELGPALGTSAIRFELALPT
ncbi:grhN [Nakamurella sp. GG22]